MREEFVENRERSLCADLERRPVVPAVRGLGEELEFVLGGDYAAVFVLGGDAFELVERIRKMALRTPVYVNVDLVSGVSSDVEGIRFLSRYVDGVISTHRRIIELARHSGLLTIQRLFAIDSGAVERGLKTIVRADPDFVEILPALAYPAIAEHYREACSIPVLAGGLVRDSEQVSSLLAAGASGVSASESRLWGYEAASRGR